MVDTKVGRKAGILSEEGARGQFEKMVLTAFHVAVAESQVPLRPFKPPKVKHSDRCL